MTNPSYPAPPPNTYPAGPAVRPATPGSVTGAFVIYLLAAIVSILGIVLVVTSNVWSRAIAENNTSGVDTQTLVNTAKIVTVVVGLIFVALYLLFAFKMRAGRNWARIVLTVLSALSIISAFSATSSVTVNGHVYRVSSQQASGWIGTVLAILAIVLMYLPASNAYFRDTKAARQQRY